MATRQSRSRDSSVSRPSLSQRPSLSRLSNPDVFSDDFALSRGNSPDASPVDSIDRSSEDLHVPASSQPPPPRLSTGIASSHLNTTNFSRPSSTSKRPVMFGDGQPVAPHRTVSTISHSDAAIQRSSSVSSNFSLPRAQSPYTGPTAPSQPYAMYPQVTRASSIASESTIRPVERPYVSTGGPEHPYGMYPQNTVEEEDDDAHPVPTIPLGFPGIGQTYGGSPTTRHDVGDIVGSDGHIEQLPPYTRYADNTIAKASSDDVPAPVAATDIPLSPISPTSDSDVIVNTAAAREAGEPTSEYNEKSKMRRRLSRKVCWGISLCVWLLVVAVIVLAATLGGVIGGVIGNDRASDAAAEAASDNAAPTATTTVWLDAAPLPTNVPAPDCTPGSYVMPTQNNSLDTYSCIADPAYSDAWGCLQQEPVPFWISYFHHAARIQLGTPGPGKPNRGPFNYGAQVPDLNGSYYSLTPALDKDDRNAGGAMFFNTLYNKLTVVPSHLLNPSSRRSVKFAELDERDVPTTPVSIYEQPYFCWFNQTLLELFIYSNLSTAATADNSTSYAYPSSTTPGGSSFTGAVSTSMSAQTTSAIYINQLTPTTTEAGSYPSSTTVTPSWTWSPSRLKARDEDEDYQIYPKQVQLAEKRAPRGDDVTPYCVQMQINPDWTVYPIENTLIVITEVEPAYPGKERRWNRPRQTNNLDSDCACQWYST